MARNILREVRNPVAREKALSASDEFIASLYAEGQERIDFRFDAFQLWSHDGADEVFRFVKRENLHTDNWNRGVFSLSKEQAMELARLVEEWNADWEYQIARQYAVEPMDYYNAYRISFSPASGTEHCIEVPTGGRHTSTSWQWNG